MGRPDLRTLGQGVGHGARRGVLGPGKGLVVGVTEQIGAPGGAVEQRPSGEYALRPVGALQDIRQVVEGVLRGGQHPQPQPRRGLQHGPVGHPGSLEFHVVLGGQRVDRAGQASQLQAAGDVVVVHVGLHHMRDPRPQPPGHREHPVHVTLRVDHHRHLTISGEVAAVTQRRGLDHLNVNHNKSPPRRSGSGHWVPVSTGRPDAIQPLVPPATDTGCAPAAANACAASELRPPDWQITYNSCPA